MSTVLGEQLLRKREAATKLACSLRTIERMVSAGELTKVLVRSGVRFRSSEVVAIMLKGAK